MRVLQIASTTASQAPWSPNQATTAGRQMHCRAMLRQDSAQTSESSGCAASTASTISLSFRISR